jgi:hypothetical protein
MATRKSSTVRTKGAQGEGRKVAGSALPPELQALYEASREAARHGSRQGEADDHADEIVKALEGKRVRSAKTITKNFRVASRKRQGSERRSWQLTFGQKQNGRPLPVLPGEGDDSLLRTPFAQLLEGSPVIRKRRWDFHARGLDVRCRCGCSWEIHRVTSSPRVRLPQLLPRVTTLSDELAALVDSLAEHSVPEQQVEDEHGRVFNRAFNKDTARTTAAYLRATLLHLLPELKDGAEHAGEQLEDKLAALSFPKDGDPQRWAATVLRAALRCLGMSAREVADLTHVLDDRRRAEERAADEDLRSAATRLSKRRGWLALVVGAKAAKRAQARWRKRRSRVAGVTLRTRKPQKT